MVRVNDEGKNRKEMMSPECDIAGKHVAPSHSSFAHSSTTNMQSHLDGSPQKVNFTAQYRKAPWALVDKLEEYFKLPHVTIQRIVA